MNFGSNQYGANIYGSVEQGGGQHRLLAYVATFQKMKGRVIGVLTGVGRKLGVVNSGV